MNDNSRQKTCLMTQTKCIFFINSNAIHGHYSSAIKRKYAETAFFEYLQIRHKWTADTMKKIDWQSFLQAARTYPGSDVHLMKLVHDKLPTNYIKSRYQSWTSARCHFCEHPETFEHLCLSPCNPRSEEFRTNLTNTANHFFLRTNTSKLFAQCFHAAMQAWLHSNDPQYTPQWPGPLDLFHAQKTIGWHLMFRGFLTRQWKQTTARWRVMRNGVTTTSQLMDQSAMTACRSLSPSTMTAIRLQPNLSVSILTATLPS